MMPSAIDIRSYAFTGQERLLLDANVWLSIYGPDPTHRRRSAIYQAAFRKMREASSRLFLDVLILSEFINACARMEYRQRWPEGLSGDFKQQFRDSADFLPVAQEIAINATRICCAVTKCGTGFDAMDVGRVLVEYARGQSDFNDLVLSSLCIRQGFAFVTDDADFKGSGHPILTANSKLLEDAAKPSQGAS